MRTNQLIVNILEKGGGSNLAIIGLHGWTGSELSFEPITKMLNMNNSKWYLPRAPYLARHSKGNSWFEGSDKTGWNIDRTWNGMNDLINRIIADGFTYSNIFIIGFSQGACLSIEFALRLPFSIGGIVPIAGFIKFENRLIKERTEESIHSPILLLHGVKDEVVPVGASETAFNILKKEGYTVQLEKYNAGHKISSSLAPLINQFIIEG